MAVLPAAAEQVSWTEAVSQIPDERSRRAFVQRNRELQNRDTVQKLFDEVVRMVRVDLRRAHRLANLTMWLARKLGDDASKALGFRALGHVYYLKSKHQLAREYYEAAIEIYAQLRQDVDRARTMTAALQSLIYLGEYELAGAWSAQAREIFEKHGDRLRLARLDTNVGNIFHRQDRFQDALDYYRRAYAEFERQGQVLDTAIVLRNMGVCFISLNQFSEALETYERAREFCNRQQAPILLAEVEYNVAYLYFLRGEYSRAIDWYEITRQLCTRAGDPYHRALCDLDQSEMYLELNMSTEAARLAENASAGFRNLGMRYEIAKATAFMGFAASRLGQRKQALKLFEKSRELFVQENNQIWPAVMDLYGAVVSYEDGDDAASERLSRAALQVFAENGIQPKAALCELLLSRVSLRAGDFEAAQALCGSALERLESADSPAVACHIHLTLGRAQELLGDTQRARKSFEATDAVLEQLRGELSQEDSKIAFLKDKVAVYESLVSLLLRDKCQADDEARAFHYIEKAKSRSLAELVALRATSATRTSGDRVPTSIDDLRDRINWTTHRLEREQVAPESGSAARVRQLREEVRHLKQQLAGALVACGDCERTESDRQMQGTLELTEIQASLPPVTAILEYYECRQSLLACVVDRNQLRIIDLGPVSPIRDAFRLLKFQFSKFRLGQEYVTAFSERLCEAIDANLEYLYRSLIAPVRSFLDCEKLVVVPHGFLHQLPFHALASGGRHLLDDFEISYAPSASILAWLIRRPETSATKSLILSVPDPLAPQIKLEAERVAAALPDSQLFLGEAANLETLRALAPDSRFIHIAAHGYFHQENPLFSSVRLGDCSVTLRDLYQLKLSSELVALSGCGTGLTGVVGADELLGLARGLLQSGAHSMMVSLWDVHDASTTELMSLFYKNLSTMTKCQALRKSCMEIRRTHVHPYYWAPFVLVGKPC